MKPLRLIIATLILGSRVYAQNENGVSLTIRIADGTSRFHAGEVIPVELSFQASTPEIYDIETRNYDRSGRLNIEQFHVTPPGRDPLQKFYSIGGFLSGGLGGSRELSAHPLVIREDLNEWVALNESGHYSLRVTSRRVSPRGQAKQEPLELESNSVEFDVVPADADWQHQMLSSALATLNIESSTADAKSAAMRTIRFLDTPDSVRELVRLLGTRADHESWDAIAGLAGSRDQKLVVSELEGRMTAADIAVTRNYLFILSRLKFWLNHEPPPPYPKTDAGQRRIWDEQRERDFKELTDIENSLYEKAAALVPSKQGKVRAETMRTILQRPVPESGEVLPVSGMVGLELAPAFAELSEEEQWALLNGYWARLRIPAMVTPLKSVAERPEIKFPMLRDLALRCLYDLDPSEATPIFLKEIRNPHIDDGRVAVNAETLGLLPKETLPQFDEMLAARLAERESRTRGLDAQLVARFSTNSIQTTVKALYEASLGKWDCITEDGFVLYFLHVDSDYGVKRLAQAPSYCMKNSLPAVIKLKRWNEVEPGVIARLNGPDLNRARQAAEALAKYGSRQAENALWDRLRRFHAQWAERGGELTIQPGMKNDANEATGFQYGLVESIGRAQAWLLSNEEITELENLTFGQERDNVRQWHWASPVDMHLSFVGEQMLASIHQYVVTDVASLRSKLSQYPNGTHFAFDVHGPAARVAPVVTAISEIADERAFHVDSALPMRGPTPD